MCKRYRLPTDTSMLSQNFITYERTLFPADLWNAFERVDFGFVELKPNSMAAYLNNKLFQHPAFQNVPNIPALHIVIRLCSHA